MMKGKVELPTGFNAMGMPVPSERLGRALEALREMVPGISTEEAMRITGEMASHLEMDRPYDALGCASESLDLTGRYRMMATLLT